jgi:hypothetical protein
LALEHTKLLQDFLGVAILQEHQSVVGAVPRNPHAKDPLASAQVFHLKPALDLVFEEMNVRANNDKIFNVYVHAAELSLVLVDEETGVNNGGLEVDGNEEVLEGLVLAAQALLQPVERLLELQNMNRRNLNSDAIGDFYEEVFFWYSIEESALDIHFLDIKVVHRGQTKNDTEGSESTSWSKCGVLIDAFDLAENSHAEACCVFQ